MHEGGSFNGIPQEVLPAEEVFGALGAIECPLFNMHEVMAP